MALKTRFRARWTTPGLVVMVAAAALIVYSRAWEHPFVYDDVFAVREHPVVRGDHPWHAVVTSPYWPRDYTPDPLYRPLALASFRVNAALFGMGAFSFHVVNSILHACAASWVALIGIRLWGRVSAGWIAGTVFAVHPALTEAVAPIVGRSELLASAFILLMLYLHIGRVASERGPSFGYHVGLSAVYALACASKEHGILAVALIGAVDVWSRQRSASAPPPMRRWLNTLGASHYLGLILVAAGVFLARWAIFGWQTSLPPTADNTEFNPLDAATPTARVATAFQLLLLAIRLMVVPIGLCPIWAKGGVDVARALTAPEVLAGVALAIVLAGALWVTCRRGRALFVPLAGLVLFLLIPCHFIPVANWFFAERWLYAPAAMLLVAASGVATLAPRASVVAAGAVVCVFSVVAWGYQACWRSNEAIIHTVVERQPTNYVGLREACKWYERRESIESAAVYIARLVEHHPDEAWTWYFQAKLLVERGSFVEADGAMERFRRVAFLGEFTPKVVELSRRIARELRED